MNHIPSRQATQALRSRRDQARELILGRILDGTYPPGHRLLELQLARELRISQTTVREALRELEATRLVETTPYRGTRVRPVYAKQVADAFRVRATLEALAAETAGPEGLRRLAPELGRRYDALLRAARDRDVPGYARANYEFHLAIVAASGNEPLQRIWEELSFEHLARVRLDRAEHEMEALAEKHLPILEAVRQGNVAAAGALLKQHSRGFADWIERKMTADREQGEMPHPELQEAEAR